MIKVLLISASLLVSVASFADTFSGTVDVFPVGGNSDMEVAIRGEAAKAIFEAMTVTPKYVGPGTMMSKQGPNIACYGGSLDNGKTKSYTCSFQPKPDGTTLGQ